MAEKKTKHMGMERAPYWYNTPLKDLDFGLSKEEELEIERYCEKIHKNIAEEDMTPIDRFNAHLYAKPGEFKNADRKLMHLQAGVVYATRTLDSYADALRPIDLYHNPKLLLKGKLATLARFKADYCGWMIITYTEGLWGGHARMVDYGNPSLVGDAPIKTMEDLEKAEVPDPYEDGLYPGYLWTLRELRNTQDKYKLPVPVWTSMCPGPSEVAQMAMLGWTGFQMALRRNPKLARAAAEKGLIWNKRFGEALIKEGKCNAIYCCQFTGGFPLSGGNEWVADLYAELGHHMHDYAVKTNKHDCGGRRPAGWVHLSHGYSYLTGIMDWYKVMNEHGSLTEMNWDGGSGGRGEGPLQKSMEFHRDHNLFQTMSIENTILEKGTHQQIEEATKELCEWSSSARKFTPNLVPVYFCPPDHTDALIAATKKYTKL